METTEIPEIFEQPGAQPGLILTPEAQSYLRESGKWANFLGIVGFIYCGIFFIMALFIGTIFSILGKISPIYSEIPAGIGGVFTVIFILVDLIYFFFALYLYQFGSSIKKGLAFVDTIHLTKGLEKLKSFFKLWGILTIVMLCLMALEVVGGILIGIAYSHR